MPAVYDVITNQIIYIGTHNIKKQQMYEQVLRIMWTKKSTIAIYIIAKIHYNMIYYYTII
jgi:hypothetical protein